MKLSSLALRSVLAASIAALAAGCVLTSSKAPPPPSGGPVAPAADPALTADGQHFAASRTYQGECAPPGSRGGCYSVTLEPDGGYRHVLLDAAITGTYVISGSQVQFTPAGSAPPETMTLSADRTRLDDFVYQPADGPTQGPVQGPIVP
ncbi:MAG: hypothetical protein IPL61_35605 [Myxococcales bacterium]|nr:hypothetical protein [Myxococcales bacterium]